MNVPDDLRYAASHEWLRADGTVGITDHAQHELADVVYVELPKVGTEVQAGEQICVVESVKAASDIYAPAGGRVASVNGALSADPALLNTDPYGAGWIFKLELAGSDPAASLKSADEYRAQIAAP